MNVFKKMSAQTKNVFKKFGALMTIAFFSFQLSFAQGSAGIDAASSELGTYMDPLGNMMMVLGGIVGLVGAIRVYMKWNSGDQDVQKSLMGGGWEAVFSLL